jgi:chromosome segregation ATPase
MSQLQQQAQELVLGDGGLDSVAKFFVSLATGTLKLINALGGFPTIILAITTAFVAFNKVGIANGLTNLITSFSTLKISLSSIMDIIPNAIAMWQSYYATQVMGADDLVMVGGTVVTLNEAIQASIPIIGLALLAITAITAGVSAYNQKQKEMEEARKQSMTTAKQEIDSLTSVQDQLSSESLTREELNQIVDSNLKEYDNEIGKIGDLNKARQEAIDKINEQKKAEAQSIVDTGIGDYTKALAAQQEKRGVYSATSPEILKDFFKENSQKLGVTSTIGGGYTKDLDSYVKSLQSAIEYLNSLNNGTTKYSSLISSLSAELQNATNEQTGYDTTIQQVNDALAILGEVYDPVTHSVRDLTSAEEREIEEREAGTSAIENDTDATQNYIDVKESLGSVYDGIVGKLDKYNEAVQKAADDDSDENIGKESDAFQELADSLGVTTEELANIASSSDTALSSFVQHQAILAQLNSDYKDAVQGLTDIQSSYNTLKSAVDEYNSAEGLSLDTITALLNLDPSYLNALIQNGNQLSLNEGIIRSKIDAQADEAKQIIYNTAIEKLNAIASSDAGDKAKSAGDNHSSAVSGINSETDALNTNTKAKVANAAAEALARGGESVEGQVTEVLSDMNNQIGLIDKAVNSMTKNFNSLGSSAKKAGKSAGSAAKSAADDTEKAYKEMVEQYQKYIENQYKTGEIDEKTYLEELYALNESYYGKLSGKGTKYLEEYEKNQQTIYNGIKELAKKSIKDTEDALQDQIDAVDKAETKALNAIQDQIDGLKDEEDAAVKAVEKQIDALKDEEDRQTKAIEKRIDALKDEKETVINGIEDQITALKKQKDVEDAYWDDKISALKKANEELTSENQLMQLQESLAQAQQTKTRVLGESGQFEYTSDQSAVSSAEQALSDYKEQQSYEQQLAELEAYKQAADDNYDEQVSALEDLKDAKEDLYEQQISDLEDYEDQVKEHFEDQISALEDYKDQLQDQYDAQIKQLEDQKDALQKQYDAQKEQLKDQLDNYKKHEDELIAKQVEAIQKESANWETRLANLKSFVDSYNAMMAQLGGSGSATNNYNPKAVSLTTTTKHAKGVASVGSNEVAMVGDSPNNELIVGSRLNGLPMKLSKGSGVVNAQSTNTLAGLLNTIGRYGNSFTTSNNSSENSTSISIGNITLPSVSNGEEFVSYLQNFKVQMTQEAYSS